jgi:hypothetical protein
MNKTWRRALLMVPLMLMVVAGRGFASRPCTCDDIPRIKARLAQRARLAAAAAQVVAEAARKWFSTAGWAKERFKQIAFPNQEPTVEGVQDYGKPPQITEELKNANCESIWKATQAHEDDHAAFDKTISNTRYPWIMVFGQEGGSVLAPKEARGYAVEVAYLTKELERIQKECDPWTGTISYRLVQNREDASERKAISGDGTVTTTTKSSVNYDVTIRIESTGRPRAFVTANESDTSEEIGKVRIDCRRPTIARHEPEWKSAGWDHVTSMEHTASGNVDAGVSVTFANGRYRIDLDVPEIQGTTNVIVRKHNDGGCGKPNDNNPAPVRVPWHMKKSLPVIDNPVQKPDALQGRDSDGRGGIVTWNLTRTPMRK